MAGAKYYEKITETLPSGETVERWISPTNLPTPDEVRNKWCFGLPLSKEDGTTMTDEMLIDFLMGAIEKVEIEINTKLIPTVYCSNPHEKGYVEGVDYDEYESPMDYDAKQYRQYGFLQLKNRPVNEVMDLELVLPNGMKIIDFKTREEWIKLYGESGQIHIVPYAGDPTLFAMLGGSNSGYPFATGRINSNLPQMFYVRYEAGFKLGKVPKAISNAIAKIASIDVLGIAGDAILAGIASMSTSMDGLSESMSTTASATNATYGAHILQYQKEVDKFFDKGAARTFYNGITMA